MTSSASGEPHAAGLCVGLGWAELGIHGLVLRGIGHGQPGAVHPLDRSASPEPALVRLLAEQAVRVARQRTDHLQRQVLTRSAIPTGPDSASSQAIGRSASRRALPGVSSAFARSGCVPRATCRTLAAAGPAAISPMARPKWGRRLVRPSSTDAGARLGLKVSETRVEIRRVRGSPA
jgi:hypothetical protein